MDISKVTEQIESVSKQYTKKFKIKRDNNWLVLKLQEELGELIQAYLMLKGQARAKGKSQKKLKQDFANEITDVFCHVLLLAKYNNIDLDKGIKEKWLIWIKQPK